MSVPNLGPSSARPVVPPTVAPAQPAASLPAPEAPSPAPAAAPDAFRPQAPPTEAVPSDDMHRAANSMRKARTRSRRARAARPEPSSAATGGATRYGAIALEGKELPRLGPVPTPLKASQQKAFNLFVKHSLGLTPGFGLTDWRSSASAREAVVAAPVKGPDGKPVSLGALAIYRVGGTNLPPSPAFLFRMAKHADKLVVAYQNPHDPAMNKLRPVEQLEGVPVPPELRGKIFAIGDPDNRSLIAYDQASDHFVEQFSEMKRSAEMLGLDPLRSKATVLGNSEATQDSTLTRDRLEAAGFGDAIGRVVAISGGWRGEAPAALKAFGKGMIAALEAFGPAPDGRRMVESMSDRAMREQHFTPDKERLVDLSIASVIGSAPKIRPRLGIPPFELANNHNIRPGMRAAGASSALADAVFSKPIHEWPVTDLLRSITGGVHDSDGLVPTSLSRFGKRFVVMDEPHDHAGIIENWRVVDRILEEIPRL